MTASVATVWGPRPLAVIRNDVFYINDLIKENDKILIIAASDLEQTPTTSDRVLVASIEYQIIRINIDENDNQNIKYEIYLRA